MKGKVKNEERGELIMGRITSDGRILHDINDNY